MKTRVTLTVEPSISHRAKTYARSQGLSVSSLVETLLSREIGAAESPVRPTSFSQRWKGRFALVPKNEPRFQKLKSKYSL